MMVQIRLTLPDELRTRKNRLKERFTWKMILEKGLDTLDLSDEFTDCKNETSANSQKRNKTVAGVA